LHGTLIEFATTDHPEYQREDDYTTDHKRGPVHIDRSDRSMLRDTENDGKENDPDDGDKVDG
jgi:hypothetical protein